MYNCQWRGFVLSTSVSVSRKKKTEPTPNLLMDAHLFRLDVIILILLRGRLATALINTRLFQPGRTIHRNYSVNGCIKGTRAASFTQFHNFLLAF